MASTNDTSSAPVIAELPLMFNSMHFVMIMGMFMGAILCFDLHESLKTLADKKTTRNLRFMFVTAAFAYVMEFFFTFGSVIGAMCPIALWALGICHYSIKVIVSYSYVKRCEIALLGSLKFKKSTFQKLLKALTWAIALTAISNYLKVLLVYRSYYGEPDLNGNQQCVYDLGGYWGYLDEIMFGAIDCFTLSCLIWFRVSNDIKGETAYVLDRVIIMSSITFGATIFAVWVNAADPRVGLTSSIMDITTDILTMMKIFTRPRKRIETNKNNISTRFNSSRKNSRLSISSKSPSASSTGGNNGTAASSESTVVKSSI